MTSFPLLSFLAFLPLVGVLFIMLVPNDGPHSVAKVRLIALITTGVTFAVSLALWAGFDYANPGFQFVETHDWLGGHISYEVGVDGISLVFIVLTTFLMPFCVLSSWESVQDRLKGYMIAFLLLETMLVGLFCALDLVVFYVFFEGSLIPIFLIIGVWGGNERVYASFKFFFYMMLGSVPMLVAIMTIYWQAGTTDIIELMAYDFPVPMQTWLWLAFFISFAVKMPMWPLHTWLPDAQKEAPTAGSIVLAIKLAAYGFLRFCLPMFPVASDMFAPFVMALSVIAIIYASLVALAQEDMKKLIAYSAIAHMGFVTLGIFSMTETGLQGGLFEAFSNSLVSAAMFLAVGMIYDRLQTREISAYGGLANKMPRYAVALMVFTMANVGLPGTSGFVGEFMAMVGAFQINTWFAILAATGVILSAAYALYLYRRVIFGALDKEHLKLLPDLSAREMAVLVPMIVAIIVLGFYPMVIMDVTQGAVSNLLGHYEAALHAVNVIQQTAIAAY